MSFACEPALNTSPWFNTTITIDTGTLPRGVVSKVMQDTYYFSNEGSEPFYIIRAAKSERDSNLVNAEIPPGYVPVYKIVEGKVYYWDFNEENWKIESHELYDKSFSFRISEFPNDLFIIEGQMQQIFRDNRPDSVDIPKDQKIILLSYFDGKIHEITGKLSYSLNESYNSNAVMNAMDACDEWDKSQISFLRSLSFLGFVVYISVGLIVVFLGYKIYRLIRVNKK
jgi:hypothetical protein